MIMASTSSHFAILLLWTVFRFSDQCGPGSIFPTAKVLETDAAGHDLMNVTEVSGVTWSISLKEDPSYKIGSDLYSWLDAAVLINNTAVSGYHVFQLKYTLDLEYIYQNWSVKLSVMSYTITCQEAGNPDVSYEWFLQIEAVNEFAPEFIGAPFNISLPENTALQTVAIRLRDNAKDLDVVTSSLSDIHEFSMGSIPLPWNMSDLFSMEDKQNGEVRVARALDFESFPGPDEAFVQFNITVWDLSRWNTTSTLTLTIQDVDDQPPYFFYPGCNPIPCEVVYSCEVASDFTGVVTSMEPASITARDGDSLDYNVTYRIKTVTGLESTDFAQYMSIDRDTGEFSILQPISSPQLFVIIQAVEVSQQALSKDATLIVRVLYPAQTTPTSPNGTADTPRPGSSTEGGESNSMIAAVVVLSIFVLLALIGLVLLVLYMKKRSDKPIYPASGLKDMEVDEEERGEEKRGTGGSRTDSGQWSMSGMPSPSPHAGTSTAPAHTRLTPLPSNGHLANGHVGGQSKKSLHGRNSHVAFTEDSLREEGVEEASEYDTHSEPQVENRGSTEETHSPIFTIPLQDLTDSPLAHAQPLGSDHVTETGSYMMLEAEDDVMGNGGPVTLQPGRLPPLPVHPVPLVNGATPKRSRASRKQRKEQMLARQREEVFDGTKTFPMAADDSFFKEGPKHKVKMSTRRKKREQHPSHWLTVDNHYTEM